VSETNPTALAGRAIVDAILPTRENLIGRLERLSERVDQLAETAKVEGRDGIALAGLAEIRKTIRLRRPLGAELTQHLGYERGILPARGTTNSRNGYGEKTSEGELTIEVPRDRSSSFEPVPVPKGETHFDGFDDKIISMYARGMTVREDPGPTSRSCTGCRPDRL
jgi:transposase-like protein